MTMHDLSPLAIARQSPLEQERIADLMRLVPAGVNAALDVGARDGYLSVELTRRAGHVTALDLVTPLLRHSRVKVVQGDATRLEFADGSFDLVLCAEVLEHIPAVALETACRELTRVSRRYVLVGVPFEQDTRVGRTTCASCGATNPPWGHVNVFGEGRLRQLFGNMRVESVSFVGRNRWRTNWLAAALNDWAGNPWGTYGQEETCVACGARLVAPSRGGPLRRAASRAAHLLNRVQRVFTAERPNWIHVLFTK